LEGEVDPSARGLSAPAAKGQALSIWARWSLPE
jgi:hypothetical protein